MRSAGNGQVTVNLAGAAADWRTLHYLSVIGSPPQIKSLRATLVQRKNIHVDGIGGVKPPEGKETSEFKAGIAGTPFVHYVWKSNDPTIVLCTDPRGARLLADMDWHEMSKMQKELQQQVLDHVAPWAFVRNIVEKTELPLLESWAVPFWHATEGKRTLLDVVGDCLYAFKRTTDTKLLHEAVKALIQDGKLSPEPIIRQPEIPALENA